MNNIAPVQVQHVPRNELLLAENRRAVLRELDAFEQHLHAFGPRDSFCERASAWALHFRRATLSPNFSPEIRTRFFSLLQQLVHDSLPYQSQGGAIVFPPLDEEALLGSDGHVYGKRFLAVFLSCVPQEHRRRSPHNQTHALSLKPHLPAQFLVKWLQREGNYATDPSIDALYSQLFRHRTPFLPMQEDPVTTRRKLRAELQSMKDCAASMGRADLLSQQLHEWILRFERILTTQEIDQATERELISSLSTHLAGLGDKPYLGTDGLVYGEMTLTIRVSEQQHAWPHTAIPHALARHLADWLWSKGYSIEEPQAIKERYQALEQQGALRAIPTPVSDRLERLRRIERERSARQEQHLERILAPLQEVRLHARRVERDIEQEIRQADAQLRGEIQRLQALVEQLRQQNVVLRREIQHTDARITDIERSTQELNVACNEIEQKTAEAKESGLISIVGCVAGIIVTTILSHHGIPIGIQWKTP